MSDLSKARMVLNSKVANAESTIFGSTNNIIDWKFVIGGTAPNSEIQIFVRSQESGTESVRTVQFYCADWGDGSVQLKGRMRNVIDDDDNAVTAPFSKEGMTIRANCWKSFFYG